MKTAFSAALCLYLLQQKEMTEPERDSYTPGHSSHKGISTSEEEGSRLLAHREEKGIVEASIKKILIWRAEDLTLGGST